MFRPATPTIKSANVRVYLASIQRRVNFSVWFVFARLHTQAVWPLAIAILLTQLGHKAHAQMVLQATTSAVATTCPPSFPVPSGALAVKPGYLNQLTDLADVCDARADFFAHRGALLLMAGRLPEAATNLEKALLLEPALPGAQLDFAQALAQLGQKDAALQLVDQVGDRPDIEPSLRQWLGGLQPVGRTGAWHWNTMVQSSVGHETNLDSVTYTDTMTLYLSNGPVIVSLTESERPRAGMGVKNWVSVQAARSLGLGQVRLAAAMLARNTPNNTLANNYQADGTLSYAHPMGPGVASLRVGGLAYRKESIYAYDEIATVLKYQPVWQLASCPWGASAGLADQKHLTSPIMSGQYRYMRLEAACSHNGGISSLQITAGQDKARDATRPGGDKKRHEISLRHDQTLTIGAKPGQLSFWARSHDTQDKEILSPLLGPTVVYLRRNDVGAGYWWRLGAKWSIGFDAEYTRQNSNNELSKLKNTTFYTGIRWTSE